MDPGVEESAMAEMMGFSAFGGPDRPAKKRRYNPGADAAVTGSNSTPLGVRQQAETANVDGIDLEDGGGNAQAGEDRPSTNLGAPPVSLPQRPGIAVANGGQEGIPSRAPWYQDYYDKAFNLNPWNYVEKSNGLQPRGTWPKTTQHESKESTA